MKNLIYISVLFLALFSCSKDDDDGGTPTPRTETDALNISAPELGQKSTYIRYRSSCEIGSAFTFTGDTLEVEVTSANGNLYFHESFTPTSTLMGGMEPVTHKIISRADYLLIPERFGSYLFFFYGNDTIFTNPTHDIELLQGSCYVHHENGDPFIGEEIGLIEEFTVGDITQGQSTIVSCVPGIINLDAYLIYDSEKLKMSHTIGQDMLLQTIDGYVLLED